MAQKKKDKDAPEKGRTVSTFCLTDSARTALDEIYEELRKESKQAGEKPPSLSAIVSFGIKRLKGLKLSGFKKDN